MSKRKRKKTETIEAVADPYRESVIDEITKLDLAMNELDSKIQEAAFARDHLCTIRSCLKDGLINRPTQMEYSFEEPEIKLSDDNEIALTFEKKDG